MKLIFAIGLILLCITSIAQYAPQAGINGSTAIHQDSSIFIDWGDSVIITRGSENSCDTNSIPVSYGSIGDVKGKANGSVLSLGDAGEAIYYFPHPIFNGTGADFAIFENGFLNPTDSSKAYLELAFVEVSTDGIVYERFPAYSSTPSSQQIAGVGEYMEASLVHNLAGKYILHYGVPFDLNDLLFSSKIQLNKIHYIKIKDVIGSIQSNCKSEDYNGNIINDPFPTNFPTGGFDLDAIGIIHTTFPTSIGSPTKNAVVAYPNPVQDILYIQKGDFTLQDINVFNNLGINLDVSMITYPANFAIDMRNISHGIYYLKVKNNCIKIIR